MSLKAMKILALGIYTGIALIVWGFLSMLN